MKINGFNIIFSSFQGTQRRFFTLFVFLFSAGILSQSAISEQEKIERLIRSAEVSGYIFIRNDTEYTSREAASYMKIKLSRAGNRIKTADQFIKDLATRSSMTGRPYMVKLSNGKTLPLADWLRRKLLEIN